MPPEDQIFQDSNESAGSAATTTTTEEPSAAPAVPTNGHSTMSPDQVEEMLDARLGPITQSLQGMNQFFQTLQQRAQEPAPQPEPNQEDWNNQFYNDPKGTIQREFEQSAAGVIGPTAQTLGDLVIENQRNIIDQQWGKGAWDEVFQPSLGPVIDEAKRTNPAQLLNKSAIENAVATVTGRNVDALVARRSAMSEESTKAEEEQVNKLAQAVLSRTNLQGGIRRNNDQGPPKLDDSHNENLAAMARDKGEEPDRQLLAVLMQTGDDTGTTLEQWQSAVPKEGSKS